ncbi:MAG: hypothetical protein NTZ35_10500 [Ignavibacteriales bacterium]|nr:hypothetical protein [Ignavibacteriales bacterium]
MKTLMDITTWVLFIGGLLGLALAIVKLFVGGGPAEYVGAGIGGGFWLVSSAVTAFLRNKMS